MSELTELPIKLNGIQYNSIKEAAKQHHVASLSLIRGILQYGHHDPNLFAKVRKAQHPRVATICGKTYASLSQAAQMHQMAYGLLQNNLHRFGNNTKLVFRLNTAQAHYYVPVEIGGQHYASLKAAAKKYKITERELVANIKRYGDQDPRICRPNNQSSRFKITVAGQTFRTKNQLGQVYGLAPYELNKRFKKYNKNDIQLLIGANQNKPVDLAKLTGLTVKQRLALIDYCHTKHISNFTVKQLYEFYQAMHWFD